MKWGRDQGIAVEVFPVFLKSRKSSCTFEELNLKISLGIETQFLLSLNMCTNLAFAEPDTAHQSISDYIAALPEPAIVRQPASAIMPTGVST